MPTMPTLLLPLLLLLPCSFAAAAPSKQQSIDLVTKAVHAYWDQRVIIDRDGESFAGYSGGQTVITGKQSGQRWYDSDGGFIPEPHIVLEQENSVGIAGVAFAYIRAYQATGNKFFARAAKSLGDTMISAQKDNGTGGWWIDMGTSAYDRRKGSETQGDTIDFKRWMNYSAWGAHGNYQVYTNSKGQKFDIQGVATNDGASWLAALAQLRIYQGLPETDPDREKYLASAQWYADTLVELKDVVDAESGFKPYGAGGIPQIFPYQRFKNSAGLYQHERYPYDIPYNLMPTFNDGAMDNALFFLMEFYLAARDSTALDAQRYLAAIRLNIDYILEVYERNKTASGRGAWADQYWVNDGSDRALRPTWGRTMEPPAFSSFSARADEVLMKWLQLGFEKDKARRKRMQQAIEGSLLYWKKDVEPVNVKLDSGQLKYEKLLRSSPYYKDRLQGYDPGKLNTWHWWLYANHNPEAAPVNALVSGNGNRRNLRKAYIASYGVDALEPENYPPSGYPMIRNAIGIKIQTGLVGNRFVPHNNSDARRQGALDHYFNQDIELRFFRGWTGSQSQYDRAVAQVDTASGLIAARPLSRGGKRHTAVYDNDFSMNLRLLLWGIENGRGGVADADGDGVSNAQDPDPCDSEVTTMSAPTPATETGKRSGRCR